MLITNVTLFTPQIAQSIKQELEKELAKDATFVDDYTPIIDRLDQLEREIAEQFAAGTTLEEIVQDLNDPSHSSFG